MGHLRLGNLRRTREWDQVLNLLDLGAGAPEVASAALAACIEGLDRVSKDSILRQALWLFMRIPLAAREKDFPDALRKIGLRVSDAPDLFEVVGSFQDAVDTFGRREGGRTDLGEIAQMAAAECLAAHGSEQTPSLFAATPVDVQAAFRHFSTKKNFDSLAGDLFARLTHRYLNHFLSKEVPNRVGGFGRFPNLDKHVEFQKALELHSREATRIVQEFCGSFLSKSNYETGVSRADAGKFAYGALRKITKELARGKPNV